MDDLKKPVGAGAIQPDAKLTIKVGESEIHLEAQPEIVRQELDRLMDRLLPTAAVSEAESVGRDREDRDRVVVSITPPRREQVAPPAAAAAPPASVTTPPVVAAAKQRTEPGAAALDFIVQARVRQMIQPGTEKLLKHTTLDPEQLAALYAADPRGRIFLKKLPTTADQVRDTVLLLLYGALAMRGETSENGFRLVQGVRSMGLRIERVPRELATDSELATSFGRHRSKRYRLTADGIRHCEKLIPGLLRTLQS